MVLRYQHYKRNNRELKLARIICEYAISLNDDYIQIQYQDIVKT